MTVPPDTFYGYDTPLGQSVKTRSAFPQPLPVPSLGWVVFWLLVCWPVALLVLKVRARRAAVLT
jgi:hypothetical protein